MSQDQNGVRIGYNAAIEDLINKQISLELTAFYNYLGMAQHFDRSDIALVGFYKLFLKMSKEELDHAQSLMKFQNKRGGRIVFSDISGQQVAKQVEGLTPLVSMERSLKLEKEVYEKLLNIHTKAAEQKDPVTCKVIEKMLDEQISSINEFVSYITKIKIEDGFSLSTLDLEFQKTYK